MNHDLSNRELTVIKLAVQGFTDDMIAKELGIERGTVNSYWVRIRGKLGHLSRTELVARFVQKASDDDHAEALESAKLHAQEQTRLLKAANDEIDRLTALLALKLKQAESA